MSFANRVVADKDEESDWDSKGLLTYMLHYESMLFGAHFSTRRCLFFSLLIHENAVIETYLSKTLSSPDTCPLPDSNNKNDIVFIAWWPESSSDSIELVGRIDEGVKYEDYIKIVRDWASEKYGTRANFLNHLLPESRHIHLNEDDPSWQRISLTGFSTEELDQVLEGLTIDTELFLYLQNDYELPGTLIMNGNLSVYGSQGLTFKGGYKIGGTLVIGDGVKKVSRFDNLVEVGRLHIPLEWLTLLSENLKIREKIEIGYNWKKFILPDGFKVNSSLDLCLCNKIDRLPKDMIVKGDLRISGDVRLKVLPDNLSVAGDLILEHRSKITEFPPSLVVGGGIRCGILSHLKRIPDGFRVNGDLCLDGCRILELPKNLKVKGFLDISHTKIQRIPEGLEVGGSFDLSDTKIDSIPSGLTVNGDLNISKTPIQLLPKMLRVEGDLDVSHTKIRNLPEDIVVGGKIICDKTQKFVHSRLLTV